MFECVLFTCVLVYSSVYFLLFVETFDINLVEGINISLYVVSECVYASVGTYMYMIVEQMHDRVLGKTSCMSVNSQMR